MTDEDDDRPAPGISKTWDTYLRMRDLDVGMQTLGPDMANSKKLCTVAGRFLDRSFKIIEDDGEPWIVRTA